MGAIMDMMLEVRNNERRMFGMKIDKDKDKAIENRIEEIKATDEYQLEVARGLLHRLIDGLENAGPCHEHCVSEELYSSIYNWLKTGSCQGY